MAQLRTGPWNLTDLKDVEKNGLKVFSCFHCGGGSTMGYKLAGYDVLGGVEIDPEMMQIYRANHNPKYSFLMGVEAFNKLPKEKIPDELFDLDILDGSPPCSSFSMAGSREKAWGEKKKFREGQADQVLDDLFFHFIQTAAILRPKVVVAENVKGLIIGKAKGYVKQIFQAFNLSGYDVQLFLLNSAFMGVPQKRERTFFIARRKDLKLSMVRFNFNEKTISAESVLNGLDSEMIELSDSYKFFWKLCKIGASFSTVHPKGSYFGTYKLNPKQPVNTIIASTGSALTHWEKPMRLAGKQISRLQTFPDDYNFLNQESKYICGMSVPPYMTHRIADQIAKQMFLK